MPFNFIPFHRLLNQYNLTMYYFLIYLSAAKTPLSDKELLAHLEKLRENNKKNDITGILMYADGNFLQLLEGSKENVEKLFKRVAADKRHHFITKIKEGQEKERFFPDSSMAFYSPHHEDYATFLELDTLNINDLHKCNFSNTQIQIWTILQSFYQSQPLYRKIHTMS